MAKENYNRLRGQLRTDIAYLKNADGEITTAVFPLTVIRRNIYNRAGNLDAQFDRPIIATADKEMIRCAQQLQKHDIIDIKGMFRTRQSKKKLKCPHCGSTVIIEMPIATIEPVYIGVVEDRLNNVTDGTNYLLHCAEISNEAKVIGRVCTPTENIISGETDRGDIYARYQLAVNRKLYIKGSIDEEDHTDYPFVYSYKDVAQSDLAVLQQGALIYLDGYIHTMQYDRETTCPDCGQDFTFQSQRMNLTPYANEYLRDFKDDVLESTHSNIDQDEPDRGY